MSDVQFIWFFVLCAILWVVFSTACWYRLVCEDHKREKYFAITPFDLFGLIFCIMIGPLIWIITIIALTPTLFSGFMVKNHFYRGY